MSSYDSIGNLPAPQSDDALRKTAASQIDLEINQSVAPIQSQIGVTQGREDKSLAQIGQMFDNLQPVVDRAAQGVQTAYNEATANQKSVFDAAQANLQKLRANRAADAQALAQQIGGPVAIDEFTQPFDDAAMDLTNLAAGQQLHTSLYEQAGVQQALGFAGQVMPLVRTEQMASVRNQFEDQIKEYQDQIVALKSQKGAQVNKRFNELRTQELEYGLQRAQFQLSKLDAKKNYDLAVKKAKVDKAQADRQYGLDKQTLKMNLTKADRDYQIALRAAGNDDKRIKLAQNQYELDLAQAFGEDPKTGQKTLQAIMEDNRVKEAAKAFGLSEKETMARIAESKANTKNETAKLKAEQRTEWATLLDNAITPKAGVTVDHTYKVPATVQQMLSGQSGVYYDATSPTKYSINITTHDTIGGMQPITNPNSLVDYLVSAVNDTSVMDRTRAEGLVRSRLGLPASWHYGDKPPTTTTTPPATTTKGGGKDETAPGDITSAEGKGGGPLKTYKPTATPDQHRLYQTPSGLIDIKTATAIAEGKGSYSEEERDKMYDWFIKRGFPLPKVMASTGPNGETSKTPDRAQIYATPSGRMRISKAIDIASGQADATPAERKAMQAWFKKQGFSIPSKDVEQNADKNWTGTYNESTAA